PTLNGATGGVAIVGSYVNVSLAAVQAQLQFNSSLVALQPSAVQPKPFTINASLTTPPTSTPSFWESARGPVTPGTIQLVGALNFQLAGVGSSVSLPGSVLLDVNVPQAFQS